MNRPDATAPRSNLRSLVDRVDWSPQRETACAAGLIFLLGFVYLWPVLIGRDILAGASSIYVLAPWSKLAPADLSHFYNPTLSDIPLSYLPLNELARQAVHSWTFPSWNPRVLTGAPFYANPQTGLTSPFSLPMWLFPLQYGIGIASILKIWFAGFGTYLLARRLGVGFWAGVLSGVSFALCAFNSDWLSHETLPAVAAMLPWMVWLVERILAEGRSRDLVWLALPSAAALLGGHPGTEIHVYGATALYAVVRAGTKPELAGRERIRRLALALAGLVGGGLLTAVATIPVIEAGSGTAGALQRSGGGAVLPLNSFLTSIFPGWWGRPTEGHVLGPVNYIERNFYAGVVPFLFAAVALAGRRGWRTKAPLVVLMVFGVAVPLNAPVAHALVAHLPLFDTVQDERMLLWFQFAVALLGGLGLQRLIDRSPGVQRDTLAVLASAVVVAVVAVVALHASFHEIRTTINHFRTGTDYDLPSILALTSVGWWLIFAAAIGVSVLIWRYGPRIVKRGTPATWASLLAASITLVSALDMYHFAHGFQPMGPESKVIPPATPAVRYLEARAGQGRTTGIGSALPEDWTLNYGLNDVRGYEPPQPSLRYLRLWRYANPRQNAASFMELPVLNSQVVRVMNVLGVRYTIAVPGAGPMQGLRIVYQGDDATIYESDDAAPRVLVARQVIPVANEAAAAALLASDGFDPKRDVVVERDQLPGREPPAGSGTVTVTDDSGAGVAVDANMTRSGLVMLDDGWAKGWSVQIDGHDAPMIRVDDVMRGVVVPIGRHRVIWHYRVPGLRLGAILSVIGIVALLAVAAGPAVVRRRRRRATAA